MAALPYMKFYPADFLADTEHLTDAETGVYLKILFKYWMRAKPFPVSRLHVVLHKTEEEFAPFRQALAEFFVETEDGLWVNERLETELQDAYEKIAGKSKGGQKSALVRQARKRVRALIADEDNSDDNGEFLMTKDWEPGKDTIELIVDSNWANHTTLFMKILPEWRLYWTDQAEQRTQTGWEKTLLTFMEKAANK